MNKLQPHPFTAPYPMLPSHEIDELAADLKRNGQKIPIVLYGGKILDGRNRYEACRRAGIEPKFIQFSRGKPQDYVTSVNLLRRHLSTSDRAKIAALMSLSTPEGRPSKTASNGAVTEAVAAKRMGVSERTVQRAKRKIRKELHPNDPIEFKDVDGVAIPAAAKPYWKRREEAQLVLSKIRAAKTAVNALMNDDPMYAEVNLNGVKSDLDNASNRFAAAIPAHVCPYCKGKPDNCKACKSRGVVSEFFWRTAVPEEKKK